MDTFEPTGIELTHGINLLRQAYEEQAWGGPVAVVPIDRTCGWDHGDGRCSWPLENAVVLLAQDGQTVHVVAFCEYHSKCLKAAVKAWRETN